MSTHPVQGVQLPATQVFPIMQLVHNAPPVPQREGVVLVMHAPLEVQQPLGQVVASHIAIPPPVPPPVAPPVPPPVAVPPPAAPPPVLPPVPPPVAAIAHCPPPASAGMHI